MDSEAGAGQGGIPSALHSVYTGGPFETCVQCERGLLQGPVLYAVEKVIRSGEVVFEYAICAVCTRDLVEQFSEESTERIRRYLEETELPLAGDEGMDAGRCHRCGRSDGSFTDEHTVAGMLLGRQLLGGLTSICGSCLEGMDELLSQKTRDVHDDFVSGNFPGVPAELDLPIGTLPL